MLLVGLGAGLRGPRRPACSPVASRQGCEALGCSASGRCPWRRGNGWCPIQNTDRVLVKLKSMECPSWIFVGCYKDTTSAEIFIRSIVNETNDAAEFAGERSADLAGGRRSSIEHSNVADFARAAKGV